MALSIKNKKVEDKARRLARLTGKPITEALSDSLDLSLLRQSAVQKPTVKEQLWEKIREIQKEYAALPDRDTRSPDEIIGYNEFGHFD
jgi:antitoxin VapB